MYHSVWHGTVWQGTARQRYGVVQNSMVQCRYSFTHTVVILMLDHFGTNIGVGMDIGIRAVSVPPMAVVVLSTYISGGLSALG